MSDTSSISFIAAMFFLSISPAACFADDRPDYHLKAEQTNVVQNDELKRRSTRKLTEGAGWLAGRVRRVLVPKAADEGAWMLWRLDATRAILDAYNEHNEQFGRPVGCTKFRIRVVRSGIKTARFEAEILQQRGDPKVADCFLKALNAMEEKDLHYPSLMYGRTFQFVFDVCANGHPLSPGAGCL